VTTLPAPGAGDVQPVLHETRDRIITGIVTIVPFLCLGVVCWQVWADLLRWSDVAVFGIMYFATGLGVTVGFHRHLTHRSFATSRPIRGTLAALGSAAIEGPVISWVADHRKHHAFSDQEGDPHSPRILGFWRVQLFNVYYYAREARKSDTLRRFAPDLAEDRLDRLVFSHGWTGLAAGTGVLCLALGLWAGAAAMVLHAVLYVFVLAPLINGLGHWHGRQTFRNSAYSIRLLSYVTGGESLHNNHHARPRAAKFSMAAREYDPSWTVIGMLAALRVIKVPEVAAEAS